MVKILRKSYSIKFEQQILLEKTIPKFAPKKHSFYIIKITIDGVTMNYKVNILILRIFSVFVLSGILIVSGCGTGKGPELPRYDARKLYDCKNKAESIHEKCLNEADIKFYNCEDINRKKRNTISGKIGIGIQDCYQFHPKCDNEHIENKKKCSEISLMK